MNATAYALYYVRLSYIQTLHALNCASLHIVRIIFVGDDEVRFVFINIE